MQICIQKFVEHTDSCLHEGSDFGRKLVIRIRGRMQHKFAKHENSTKIYPHGDKGVLKICENAVSKISQNTPSHLNF